MTWGGGEDEIWLGTVSSVEASFLSPSFLDVDLAWLQGGRDIDTRLILTGLQSA